MRAIGEHDFPLDSIATHGREVGRQIECETISCIADREIENMEIGILAREDDVGWRQIGCQFDHVDIAAIAIKTDGVDAAPSTEQDGIPAGAEEKGVVTAAGIEQISSVEVQQEIAAGTTTEDVVTADRRRRRCRITVNRIAAKITNQDVVAGIANEGIVADASGKGIVAECTGAGSSCNGRTSAQFGFIPQRAVSKSDLLLSVGRMVKEAGDC